MVYYSVIKAGPGRDDFSNPQAVVVHPHKGIKYVKPVVVLTDRGTYSSGSLAAMCARAIPNMMLLGDTTGGGLGMPNGGQLPNGWTYRFSVTQTWTLDKSADFENGVPPDKRVILDWANLTEDEVLEAAIQELL